MGGPTKLVFVIALILGVLGILGTFGIVPGIPFVQYMLPAGFLLLVAGILLPGV